MSSSTYSGSNIKEKLQSICNPAPAAHAQSFTLPSLQSNYGSYHPPEATNPIVYALVGLVVGAIVVLIAVKLYWYVKGGGEEVVATAPPPQPPVNANDFFNGIARSLIQQKQQSALNSEVMQPVSPVTPTVAVPPAPVLSPVVPSAMPTNSAPALAPAPAPSAPPAPPASDPLENDPNFTPI